MNDTWAVFALISAFGQALSWAIKKKVIDGQGVNVTLGAVAYSSATLLFIIGLVCFERPWVFNDFSNRFWISALYSIIANIIASWCAFRALESKVDFSSLMPLISLTAPIIILLEFYFNKTLPNNEQLIGIGAVVVGGIIFGHKTFKRNLGAYLFFSITLISYSFSSTYMGIMVNESNGLSMFPNVVLHGGIAVGFIFLFFFSKEKAIFRKIAQTGKIKSLLTTMILTGIVIAALENGPTILALRDATASEVFSIKRLMPIFAVAIGYWYFKEVNITKKMILGTVLMVTGAIVITLFKQY
ncbi:MAG: EamA family transporter [Candidatus Paceibacterota bacterium]